MQFYLADGNSLYLQDKEDLAGFHLAVTCQAVEAGRSTSGDTPVPSPEHQRAEDPGAQVGDERGSGTSSVCVS